MNELALFAGAGGGILGGHLLGWRTVCAVEWEPYPASVLCARQNDGLLPPFPIWDDVQTFDGKPWRGIVDVVSGGFPCTDISIAGRGAGLDGEQSSMWHHMARVVSEVRPRFVFVENSPMLIHRGIGRVIGDLSCIGYDSKWTVMGANDVGASHKRDRAWIVANTRYWGWRETNATNSGEGSKSERALNTSQIIGSSEQSTIMAHTSKKRLQGCERIRDKQKEDGRGIKSTYGTTAKCSPTYGTSSNWWESEPNVGRVANGVASRVDRLKAIGNGQVPLYAATAWRILNEL